VQIAIAQRHQELLLRLMRFSGWDVRRGVDPGQTRLGRDWCREVSEQDPADGRAQRDSGAIEARFEHSQTP
jgi:hypothetical protein